MRRCCPICNNDIPYGSFCLHCNEFVTPETDEESEVSDTKNDGKYSDFNLEKAFSSFDVTNSFDTYMSNSTSSFDSYFDDFSSGIRDNYSSDLGKSASQAYDSSLSSGDVMTFETDMSSNQVEPSDLNITSGELNSADEKKSSPIYTMPSAYGKNRELSYKLNTNSSKKNNGTYDSTKDTYVSPVGNTFSNQNNKSVRDFKRYDAKKKLRIFFALIIIFYILPTMVAIFGRVLPKKTSDIDFVSVSPIVIDDNVDYGENYFKFDNAQIEKYVMKELLVSCEKDEISQTWTYKNEPIDIDIKYYFLFDYDVFPSNYDAISFCSHSGYNGAMAIVVSSKHRSNVIKLSDKLLRYLGVLQKDESVEDTAVFTSDGVTEDVLSDGTYIKKDFIDDTYVLTFN